jgi:hypothetical protein
MRPLILVPVPRPSAEGPRRDIPAGTLVVVARGRTAEQVGLTATPCWGPGRWPFVLRWRGDRWTKRPAKARVLRVATLEDLQSLPPGSVARAALPVVAERQVATLLAGQRVATR